MLAGVVCFRFIMSRVSSGQLGPKDRLSPGERLGSEGLSVVGLLRVAAQIVWSDRVRRTHV